MGMGISILVAAVGAILRYAITAPVNGFDLHTAGVILMFVGVVGAVVSALFWSSFAPFARRAEVTNGHDEVVTETVQRRTG